MYQRVEGFVVSTIDGLDERPTPPECVVTLNERCQDNHTIFKPLVLSRMDFSTKDEQKEKKI